MCALHFLFVFLTTLVVQTLTFFFASLTSDSVPLPCAAPPRQTATMAEKPITTEEPVPGKMEYINPRFSSEKRLSLASDPEKGYVMDASGVEGKPMLARKLQSRHMQMIAIGRSFR